MQINRASVKLKAQELIRTSRPRVISAGLLVLLLSILIGTLSNHIMLGNVAQEDILRLAEYYENGNFESAALIAESMGPSPMGAVIQFALQVVSVIVDAGFIIFLLNTIRNAGACLGNLLDGFGMFFKIIWLSILQSIFVSLWTMLFIIPGFIAMYRYRMAMYILIDDPTKSALTCIRESKAMMHNHKAELFVFDLSFIGWALLASIPYLGYLVQVWSFPYMQMSYALYYDALKNQPFYTFGQNTPPWENGPVS